MSRPGRQHESTIIEKISFFTIALAKKRGLALLLRSKVIHVLLFSQFFDVFQFFCYFHSYKFLISVKKCGFLNFSVLKAFKNPLWLYEKAPRFAVITKNFFHANAL